MDNQVVLSADGQQSEKSAVIYKSNDGTIQLEVQLANDTVWLTQAQMAMLFGCTTDNVWLHLKNIYDEHEIDQLSTAEDFSIVRKEGNRYVNRTIKHYNLDAILSVGYRVSSAQATKFRQWANKVLKDYILKGYAINQRFERLEQRVANTEEKIDFFVKTALPPVQGIFYDGQIFDAHISENLKLDLQKHNTQYQPCRWSLIPILVISHHLNDDIDTVKIQTFFYRAASFFKIF